MESSYKGTKLPIGNTPTIELLMALVNKPAVAKKAKAGKPAKQKSDGKIAIRTADGKLLRVENTSNPVRSVKFTGNQGTTYRSSKGATRIRPNGRRYLQHDWYAVDGTVGYRVD